MKHKTAFKPIVISIVLSILLITTAVFFARHHNSIPSINTDFLQQEITEPEEPSPQIVQSARNQIGKTLRYDPAYTKLTYPMGDVPMEKGVCTDVVIRALREQNIDLQELVHQDMSRNFSVYPKRWGLKQPDTNIDHRRVPNLIDLFHASRLDRSRYKLSSWRYCNLGTKRKPSPYRHCLRPKNRRQATDYP